jgi:lysophospholipase L1-like esterase
MKPAHHKKKSTSPTLPRKEKHRSFREIYEVTKPLETLFVDLHEYNVDNFEEYQIDHLHPNVEETLEWKEAMHKEIDALEKNDTWVLIPPPKGKNIISCKCVLT